MHFQTLLPAAVLLLATTVQGAHITWKRHSTNTCNDSGGQWHQATPGQCNALSETDRAIEIYVDDRNCNFVAYANQGCTGAVQHKYHGRGCHDMRSNDWSLRMEC
ncbi:hypothetical protein BKA66DRAFT_468229 [Pyrenochaeta sp. MPI-SDFR-AT-0127]|nr:hypothetical protein BKA66DRAFT_468229 [Pyrenochaeta sp. MPI-SDFR-AT-0127]